MHYLRLFFLAAFERGDLGVKSSQAASKPGNAQAQLRIWLQQKMDVFIAQLHVMLQNKHTAPLQVYCCKAAAGGTYLVPGKSPPICHMHVL